MALNITINKTAVAASYPAGSTVATAVASGGTTPYTYSLATGGDYFNIDSSTGVVTTKALMDASSIQSFSVTATDSNSTPESITSGVVYPNIQAAQQSKFNKSNVIYKIVNGIDLGNAVLTIPANCTLDFQGGGRITNGSIILNNTALSNIVELADGITASVSGSFRKGQILWFDDTEKPKVWNGSQWLNLGGALFRNNGNKLEISYDDGSSWEAISDYIAAYFRYVDLGSDIGKIQISRDNTSWEDLSPKFTNNLKIKGYVATTENLPTNAVQGDIYGVGPTYDPSDTEHTNPIYQLYVKDSTGWVDNGRFTSISAGVVQDFGNSETEVISQKTVSEWLVGIKALQQINAFPSLLSSMTISSNKGSLVDGVVTIGPATYSPADYYGVLSGFSSYVGKKLYVEVLSSEYLKVDTPVFTNGSGNFLEVEESYMFRTEKGIIYASVINFKQGDIAVLLPYYNNLDTSKAYVLSYSELGIYNTDTLREVIQDTTIIAEKNKNELSEDIIVETLRSQITPSTNKMHYLINEEIVIPANPSDVGPGAWYGVDSSLITNKEITIVLKSKEKLTSLPKYYNNSVEIPSTYSIELRVQGGWAYINTIQPATSFIYVVLRQILNLSVANVLSLNDIGYTYSGTLKDKTELVKENVSLLQGQMYDLNHINIEVESYRDSLIATSNQTAALSGQTLTIPVGADWGIGSYFGFVTNLDKLWGKVITVTLLSSIKLNALPSWANQGVTIPSLSVDEKEVSNGWLYTNVLDLTSLSSGNIIIQPANVLDYTKEAVWNIPSIGVEDKISAEDAIKELYNTQSGIKYTVVTANSDENSNADFKGKLAIQQAFESITDASETNQYIVRATGNFHITSPNDYLNIPALGAWAYIRHKDYVHLDGIDKDSCIIRCELSQTLSEVQAEKSSFVKSDYGNYQPAFWNSKANISNVTFVARNIRYPLHIDGGTDGCKDYIQLIDNCNLIHEGKFGDSIGTVGGSASGFGMSSGQQLTLRNCYLEGTDGWVYVHDNRNFTDGSLLYFDSCRFLDSVGYSREITIQGINSLVSSTLKLRNCTLPKYGRIEYTSSINNETKLRADILNYICDMQDMEPISVQTPTSITKALRIVSKSTDSTSTVRFNPNSTAFSIVGFKDEVSLVSRNRYNRSEQYGYQYRDGGNGLQGEAIGFANIMEGAINGKYLTSLGKRLGDCSTTNKTLTIIIDGTSYNVVFNKNYNGTAEGVLPNYSNAQIIAEINAVIGSVATIEEYDINKEWYPLFKDVQLFKVNSATYIEKGMGVVFTNNMNVRKATVSDTIIDGIALDNGANDSFIRVMQNGSVTRSNTFYYSLSRGETFTDSDNLLVGIVSDGKFGPSATNKTLRCLSNAYGKLK